MGRVAGEFCPGDFTVNARGRVKLVGTAQRVVRHASLLAASVAATDGDALRDVSTDVYAALELDWDPATAGAIEDDVPGVTVDDVERAVLDAYGRRFELVEASRRRAPRSPGRKRWSPSTRTSTPLGRGAGIELSSYASYGGEPDNHRAVGRHPRLRHPAGVVPTRRRNRATAAAPAATASTTSSGARSSSATAAAATPASRASITSARPSADRLADHERGEQAGREQRHDRDDGRGQRAAGEHDRSGALQRDRGDADAPRRRSRRRSSRAPPRR